MNRSSSCISIGSETSFEARHFSVDFSQEDIDFSALENHVSATNAPNKLILGSIVPFAAAEALRGVSNQLIQMNGKTPTKLFTKSY